MNKTKIFIIVLILFFLGVASGSLLTNIYLKKSHYISKKIDPVDRRNFLINQFSQKLELTIAQQQDIEDILDQSYEQILELRLKNKPKTAEIFEKRNRLIREQLDDEQKVLFDELVVVFKKKDRLGKSDSIVKKKRSSNK